MEAARIPFLSDVFVAIAVIVTFKIRNQGAFELKSSVVSDLGEGSGGALRPAQRQRDLYLGDKVTSFTTPHRPILYYET